MRCRLSPTADLPSHTTRPGGTYVPGADMGREGNGRVPIDHRGHGYCRVSGAAVKLDPLAVLAGRPT